jgi:metal-responsive CopG/Arc/MetJ family transcriptional regulator
LKGVDKMAPLKGQKIKDNPKDTRIQIRLDKESLDKLDCLVTEQNSDRSKVIRRGIEIQYEERNK